MPPAPRLVLPLGFLVVVPLLLARCTCAGERPPDECATATDCDGNDVCVVENDGHRACAPVCGAQNPCPEGSACLEKDGTLACFEILRDLALGEPCGEDSECLSGACVGNDESGHFCAQPCVDDDGCSSPQRCYLADQRQICLDPLDDRAAGEQCDTPRHCASARCVQLLEGDDAICLDECVPAEGCTGPRNCIELDNGANVCVDYVPDGTPCSTPIICQRGRCIEDIDGEAICTGACEAGETCSEGWSCVRDAEDALVCMPLLDDKSAGEACVSARECTSGHCAHFESENEDFGKLCADPCLEGNDAGPPPCADDELVCWEGSDGPDLCGPVPI